MKFSGVMLPVGLVNFFKPLGHSEHCRLQLVVASMDVLTGDPHKTDFLRIIEI